MARELVTYSFQSPALPDAQAQQWSNLPPGYSGVLFTFDLQHLQFLTDKINAWFENCDEVIWVDSGASEKQEDVGFIILEWDNCDIPQLFLNILYEDDMIETFVTYLREEMPS